MATLSLLLGLSLAGVLVGLFLSPVNAFGFGQWGDDNQRDSRDNNGDNGIQEKITWFLPPGGMGPGGKGQFRPPRPRPPPRPFFTGAFQSDPTREVQINMYKTFQCLGLAPDYVDENIRVNISQQGRNNFQFSESVGNTSLLNFTFSLDKTNSTDFLGEDVDVTVRIRGRSDLVLSYNGTSAGKVQVIFHYGDGGFDAIFRCSQNATVSDSDFDRPKGNFTTGVRHFSQERRPRGVESDD